MCVNYHNVENINESYLWGIISIFQYYTHNYCAKQLLHIEQNNKEVVVKIALIVGSVRRDRQGIKVARWMNEKLKNRNHMVFFIDPLELNLPLLDRMYKEMVDPSEEMKSLRNK